MANQSLPDYIQEALSKGFGKGAITDKLRKSGYTDKQISDAFKDVNAGKKPAAPSRKRVLIAAILIAVLICAFVCTSLVIDAKKSRDLDLLFQKAIISELTNNPAIVNAELRSIKSELWNHQKYSQHVMCNSSFLQVSTPEGEESLCKELSFAYTYSQRNPPDSPEINLHVFKLIIRTTAFESRSARDLYYSGLLENFQSWNLTGVVGITLSEPVVQNLEQVKDLRVTRTYEGNYSDSTHYLFIKVGDSTVINALTIGKESDQDAAKILDAISKAASQQ